MKRTLMIVILALTTTCATRDAQLAEDSCVQLRDHLVELRLESVSGIDNIAEHREAMRGALGVSFIERCRAMPNRELKCALAATDSESVAACSQL